MSRKLENVQHRLEQAQLLEQAGDLHQALKLCEEAVCINPRLPEAWMQLGLLFMHLRRFADAKTAFRKVRRLCPGHQVARHRYVDCCMSLREYDEAAAKMRQALREHKTDHYAHFVIAKIEYSKGDHATAFEHIVRAIALWEEDGEYFSLLGFIAIAVAGQKAVEAALADKLLIPAPEPARADADDEEPKTPTGWVN